MLFRASTIWSLTVLVGSLVSCGRPASANLLVDPTGGTTINFGNDDDAVVSRSLGGIFNYYGPTINSIDVSTNGNLNLTGNVGYKDSPISGLPGSINPFYDDLYLFSAATVSDRGVAGSYYAATWNGVYDRSDLAAGETDTFQAILFTGNTALSGYNFRAGDIALSYAAMDQVFNSGSATVGISNGTGSTTTALPGTTDGQINDTSLLPTGSRFLLFRSGDGGATYAASTQSTAPAAVSEPASWLMMATGLLLAAARHRGRPGAGSPGRLGEASPR